MRAMHAHRAPARRYPCPGCATCSSRFAWRPFLVILAVFVAVFVLRLLVPA